MKMKLEPGDIISEGSHYFVFHGYDLNAFQFYGMGGKRFRVTKEDMGRLSDFVVVGHIQPGKGIQKRFAEFLEGTVTVKLPAHCGNLSDI